MTDRLMTTAEAATYLRYKDRSAALRWLKSNAVSMVRRGRVWLVRQSAIDRAVAKVSTGAPS